MSLAQGASGAGGGDVRSEVERNFRWNAAWFTLDYFSFGMGQAFLNQSTVLPAFASQLTSSAFLVGLVATIQSGAWLLPQLFVASLVAGQPRKRRWMLLPGILGRPTYLLLAALTLLLGGGSPIALLIAFYLTLAVFGVADGFVSLPWFDIVAKAIPADRRGRLFGTAQIVTGLVAVAVGALVGFILANPSLPFPLNYAVLFALASLAYLIGLIALAMIREPAGASSEKKRTFGDFVALLRPVLRDDRRFVRVVLARFFFGAGTLIFPFYIVFARKELGFGPESIGLFLSAQVFGGVLGGLVLGPLADHRSTAVAIRWAIPAAALAPGLALLAYVVGDSLGPLLLVVTALVFVVVGASFSSYMLAFMNYVLEIAPADDRSTYAGLYNTLLGVLLFVPALAGWFLEVTSYTALFAFALTCFGLAWLIGLRLPDPRRDAGSARARTAG